MSEDLKPCPACGSLYEHHCGDEGFDIDYIGDLRKSISSMYCWKELSSQQKEIEAKEALIGKLVEAASLVCDSADFFEKNERKDMGRYIVGEKVLGRLKETLSLAKQQGEQESGKEQLPGVAEVEEAHRLLKKPTPEAGA